jgi:hypothetical protein
MKPTHPPTTTPVDLAMNPAALLRGVSPRTLHGDVEAGWRHLG